MNTCRTVVAACVLALGALTAVPAVGQQALSAADGKSSIVPVRQGFLSLDFGQEKIGVRRYWEKSADFPPTVEICGQPFPQIPNHSEWTLGSAVSAKDGKRNLFGKGTFTPGIEASVGFAHFIERGYGASDCSKSDKGGLSSDPIGRGYHALFVTFTGTLLARNAVEESPDGQIITSEEVERGIALSGGYNRSFGRGRVLGLALEGKRIADSPGGLDPIQ